MVAILNKAKHEKKYHENTKSEKHEIFVVAR